MVKIKALRLMKGRSFFCDHTNATPILMENTYHVDEGVQKYHGFELWASVVLSSPNRTSRDSNKQDCEDV